VKAPHIISSASWSRIKDTGFLCLFVAIGLSWNVDGASAQPVPLPIASSKAVQERTFPKAWSRPIPGSILSDPALLVQADEALDHLYNMRYQKADSIFDKIESRYPTHPIGPFLKSLTLWWQILPTLTVHDTSFDRPFLSAMDQVIERSERMIKKKEYAFDAAFFKTAAHGFRGRLLSDRENWLRAAQDGKSALDHIFEIAEADTLNADLLFGAGVYEYFAEVIPGQYPIVAPLMLFFPDGDRERGLERLELAAMHGRFVSAEAAYFLLQIFSSFQPDYQKSIKYITLLRERYPDNALFHVLEGRILFRWGQWNEATQVFNAVVSAAKSGKLGYAKPLVSQAHYFLGRQDMLGGENERALEHFKQTLSLESGYSEDSFYRAHATLRSGMVYDRLGNRKEALANYKKVLKIDNHANSRDRARRFIKTPYGGDNS
jgi:tetratricopeptide (TPR) repeat protein